MGKALKLIDRYLLRELVLTFGSVLGVLLTIYISFTLARLLSQADSGLLTRAEIGDLCFLKCVIALEVLMPIALFLAVILCFGRLHQDYEFHAFGAAGVGEVRLIRPVMILALAVAVTVWLFSNYLRPLCWNKIYLIKHAAEQGAELDRIKAGEFHSFGEQQTVFIEDASDDRSVLYGVFVHSSDHEAVQVITAPKATFEPYIDPAYHRLSLEQAHVYRQASEGSRMSGQFGNLRILLNANSGELPAIKKKGLGNEALEADESTIAAAELQWRRLTAISAILLALAAVPLARSSPRQSRYIRLIFALMVYAVYYNTFGLARNAVEQGDAASMLWAPLLMAIAVGILFGFPMYSRRRKHRPAV